MAKKKKLGIIGGMGPQATIYMFNKIVTMIDARNDQDHIEIFIHNNTNIPDRTNAILYGGTSPIDELIRSSRILEQMGADILIMPCMTSHYYIKAIQDKITIPIINAIKQSVLFILKNYPKIENTGILATTGTIKSLLFQNILVQYGFKPIILSDDYQQDFVMSAIYGDKGIKAGYINQYPKKKLLKASEKLIESGSELIIAGCTEIPLVLGQENIDVPIIDPMVILAQTSIKECLGESNI